MNLTVAFSLFLFLFLSSNTNEGQYFKVDTVQELDSWMESMVPDLEPPFYKIRMVDDDSELGLIVYPPYSEKNYSNPDILMMIEELLKYEGDTRKCFMKIKCSPDLKYNNNEIQYSLQLEALYIINSIFFENFSTYSPCPILVDEANEKTATVDGPIIEKAFEAYKQWFIQVKEMGIGNARGERLDPLKGSGIKWWATVSN